jgi:hypothetical protein
MEGPPSCGAGAVAGGGVGRSRGNNGGTREVEGGREMGDRLSPVLRDGSFGTLDFGGGRHPAGFERHNTTGVLTGLPSTVSTNPSKGSVKIKKEGKNFYLLLLYHFQAGLFRLSELIVLILSHACFFYHSMLIKMIKNSSKKYI